MVDNLVAASAEKKVDKMGSSSAALKDILLVARRDFAMVDLMVYYLV